MKVYRTDIYLRIDTMEILLIAQVVKSRRCQEMAIRMASGSTFRRWAVGGALAIAIAVTMSMTTAATPAYADNLGQQLVRGQTMYPGDYIRRASGSASGYVRLLMQLDGNLVLYWDHGSTHRACWAANTRTKGYRAVYQGDGNFVVYDSYGKAVWASGKKSGTTVDINYYGRLYVGHTPISGQCP